MSTRNLLIILLHVFISHLASIHCKDAPDDSNEEIVDTFKYKEEIMRASQTKCSRRYTPGHCLGNKELVWMYVPQIQNCTGRLGCLLSRRSNRFPSFEACMSECRALIDLYSYVQDMQDGKIRLNESRLLRKGPLQTSTFIGIGRRKYKKQDPQESDSYEEGSRSSFDSFEDHGSDNADPERDSYGFDRDIFGRKSDIGDEESAGQVDYDINKHGHAFDVDPNLEDVLNTMPGRVINIDMF